jgi:tRNA threonylcarbamoyladenosine biosynthesis protein TsaE
MPILDPNTFEFISRSPDQTRRIGIRLGALLQPGDVVCLCGDLGAGKTTFTQGIARGWGALERATSPTFVLVKYYTRPDSAKIAHLDAYRLVDALEAEDLDLEMMMESGPFIIEWPERIRSALPENRLWVDLSWQDDQQRSMTFKPSGERYISIVNTLKNEMIKSYS